MARIRSIKPEFWDDRKLAKRTSRDSRLLYIALWNLADEHGRVNGDPLWIKGQVFPYEEDLDACAVEKLLTELEAPELGAVVGYESDGDPYLYLPKLAKHQRLEPEKVASRLPAPPDPDDAGPGRDGAGPARETVSPEQDTASPGQGDAHEQPGAGSSGRRADSSGRDAKQPALLYVAGSREQDAGSREQVARERAPARDGMSEIPGDFKPTDAMRRWANTTYPGVDIDHETDQFCRYWRSEGRRKKSWADAWQKWIGDAHKRSSSQARAAPQRAPEESTGTARARAASEAGRRVQALIDEGKLQP